MSKKMTFEEAWALWNASPQNPFGTLFVDNEPIDTFHARKGRCFELAGRAIIFGNTPKNSLLVHGTWMGPGAEEPYAHAWIQLSDGRIWEPITCLLVPRKVWETVTKARSERLYSRHTASTLMIKSKHWGCWHETKGLIDDATDATKEEHQGETGSEDSTSAVRG
jgi:hypothetical protein